MGAIDARDYSTSALHSGSPPNECEKPHPAKATTLSRANMDVPMYHAEKSAVNGTLASISIVKIAHARGN